MSTLESVIFSTSALLLLMLISDLTAIDIESAKERPCMEFTKAAPTNLSWLMSHKTWYYPLMSRLDLYLMALVISDKDPEDLKEDELYYDSCMRFEVEGAGYTGYGFNGIKKSFIMKPVPGTDAHEAYTEEDIFFGTCYSTLTDNKTFVFSTCCTALQQQTWGVSSPLKKLPEGILEVNKEHAKSLGFKQKFFTGFRYGHCKNDDDRLENKTEL